MTNVKCPHCGADVEVPAEVTDAAAHWQNLLDKTAKRKRDRRAKNPEYCQGRRKKKQ